MTSPVRNILLSLLVAGLAVVAIPPQPAWAGECAKWGMVDVDPSPGGVSMERRCIEWEDGGNTGDDDTDNPQFPVETGPVKQYYRTPACSANGPPPGDPNALCRAAVNSPMCADDEIRMRVFSRSVNRQTGEPVAGAAGNWHSEGTECSGPDDPPGGVEPPRITVEMVMGFAATHAPTAEVHMEPNGESWVNITNNFYIATDPISDTLTVLGIAIPVTYTPVSHTWNFGDEATASGAGIDNASVGQPGSVEHAYDREGDYNVTVTTDWSVTFTLPGQGQVTPPGTISSTSAAYPVTIGEIQSVVTKVR